MSLIVNASDGNAYAVVCNANFVETEARLALLEAYTGLARTPYEAVIDPAVTNDAADSAAIGRTFKNGDTWLNTAVTPRRLWVCLTSTTGAAIWWLLDWTPTTTNKNMTCSETTVDGALATANTLLSHGLTGGYVQVMVNGIQVSVGDGVKTKDCYFSGDGGTTARAIVDIVAGDRCYWMGSVAGYQLATTDVMDWNIS